ncbi:MAG: phytanoyl-CoA dioxygenase family protein [Acidobacteria bacterium]|nr:phytanoyl-CoA dioxygenase family protein [Acidobacteriota bacterium]
MKLTAQQLTDYECQGFLVLENFVSAAACDELQSRAAQLVADFEPHGAAAIFSTREQQRKSDDYFLESGDKIRFFFEEQAFDEAGHLRRSKEQSLNKIGHALHDLDPVFDNFSRTPALQELVASLGYAKPLLLQSMYIFKPPNLGGEVTCHQDATFLYTEPMSLTGLWFALEDANRDNGCLWALAGGHRSGLKARFVRASAGGAKFIKLDESPWPVNKLTCLEVAKGTLILLHGLLPHLSYANTSARSRHAYTLHISASDSAYPPENWLQRSAALPWRGFS